MEKEREREAAAACESRRARRSAPPYRFAVVSRSPRADSQKGPLAQWQSPEAEGGRPQAHDCI
eukprot:6191615-Pleurochrysis_carterae.AAC.1